MRARLHVKLVVHLRRERLVTVQRVRKVVGAVLPARRAAAALKSKVLEVQRVAARFALAPWRGGRGRLPQVRGVRPSLK